jgi:hypothetical protein
MGSLVIPGQIYVHIDFRHGLLLSHGLIQHGNRVADPLDTHLIDVDISMVRVILYIFHEFLKTYIYRVFLKFPGLKVNRKITPKIHNQILIFGKILAF